uniref:Uncharacterized protein n=1 Tax=Anopheles arabiensis TaxID=7173 RepID=A0A182IGC6_ANOAR
MRCMRACAVCSQCKRYSIQQKT